LPKQCPLKMSNTYYLGIDTSNYTTSVALCDNDGNIVNNIRVMLPVKEGQMGLRQSDAVFLHVKNLSELQTKIISEGTACNIAGIGVSVSPTTKEGSYMPCFMVGISQANILGNLLDVPVYSFSHQQNHVVAALYGADAMHLLKERFLAFHVSGGTTDAMIVEMCDRVPQITLIASSLDLKAGQAVDRVGGMLGLPFPAGRHMDKLACESSRVFKIKPTLKGLDPCLSGVENKCRQMLEAGEAPCDIAAYCIAYIEATLTEMTTRIFEKHGKMPVLYAGGVMSNSIISKHLSEKFGGFFAPADYSSDNASGNALMCRAQMIK